MGTRSRIGILNADGTVESIYCHWDGYLSHNGRILAEHYRDEVKVRELIELGGLSTLGSEIGVKHPFSEYDGFTGSADLYRDLYGNMCTAYKRDRGEDEIPKTVDHGRCQYIAHNDVAYYYLFDNGVWMVSTNKRWRSVEQALLDED